MFLDPTKLHEQTPAAIFEAASQGHIGLDHRFLRALLDRREESLPAAIQFADGKLSEDAVDLTPELIALFRHWKAAEAVPFLVRYIKEDPEDVPDEAIETLVAIGAPALEPLLQLYSELEEEQGGEVAFVLASLRVRDPRILQLLLERLDFDLSDTLLLLTVYGDPAAIPALQAASASLAGSEDGLRKEMADAEEALASGVTSEVADEGDFDIWDIYPDEADVPVDLLDEEERAELLDHPIEAVRLSAANSFFNRDLTPSQRGKLLNLATQDAFSAVRAKAWEALSSASEEPEVNQAMLDALRRSDLPIEERGGLLVGLASEADRNEVRTAMNELYAQPEGRAKALEAMWRSLHPSFRDNFAKNLDSDDLEIRRGAIWGIGYYAIKAELDRVREFFKDDELRSDALFAYALAMPGETSRGRMKGLLSKVEKDARGLSEMEEELVKRALDERLVLAGKEPVFAIEED
jgi:hypothetical protein